ncbi:hypothetical protein [uncultured Bosea sp.]|nr:hypothetical protein [uncultured Bosea sp.]
MDEPASSEALVYVNGGQRGLQIALAAADLLSAANARSAAISA